MTTENKLKLREVRKKAWETRRKLYGNKGHADGAYTRSIYRTHGERIERMENALIKLHLEEILSEGQVCQITGLDRITLRQRADKQKDEK